MLTPRVDPEAQEIRLSERGLAQASVFPGFCEEHEALFAGFENTKILRNPEALWLQIYRSVCREIVRLEVEIACSEQMLAIYRDLRNSKLQDMFMAQLGSTWLAANEVTICNLDFTCDSVDARIQQLIGEWQDALTELSDCHLAELEKFVGENARDNRLEPEGFVIDAVIPVALSGIGGFDVSDQGIHRKVRVALGIFPNSETGNTICVIHGKEADQRLVQWYLARLVTPFDALNMVEQWMIRGTDHWFTGPDIWERKVHSERQAILREILDTSKGIADELPFSIFDDLRLDLIEKYEHAGLDDHAHGALARERLKLGR